MKKWNNERIKRIKEKNMEDKTKSLIYTLKYRNVADYDEGK